MLGRLFVRLPALVPVVAALKLGLSETELFQFGGAWTKASDIRSLKNETTKVKFIYQIHIPRTGGSSFEIDANSVMFGCDIVLKSTEGCYSWQFRSRYGGNKAPTIVMLRAPREQVLSEYLYCNSTLKTFGASKLKKDFPHWVHEWKERYDNGFHGDFAPADQKDDKNTPFALYRTSLPDKCYWPINLQSQRLTCEKPEEFTDRVDKESAMRNLANMWFVGITEAYSESLCLLNVKVKGTLPKSCTCTAKNERERSSSEDPFKKMTLGAFARRVFDSYKTAAGYIGIHLMQTSATTQEESQNRFIPRVPTSIDHGTPHRDLASFPPETIRAIDHITDADRELYRAGVSRFLGEVAAVEERFGTKVLCDHTRALLLERSARADSGAVSASGA